MHFFFLSRLSLSQPNTLFTSSRCHCLWLRHGGRASLIRCNRLDFSDKEDKNFETVAPPVWIKHKQQKQEGLEMVARLPTLPFFATMTKKRSSLEKKNNNKSKIQMIDCMPKHSQQPKSSPPKHSHLGLV
ncbi:hypothetical protein SESBI_15181 [Sesbania bispinosa]|nr:hypothetical protein SESBI_15181 [Sesbania bispinosa]